MGDQVKREESGASVTLREHLTALCWDCHEPLEDRLAVAVPTHPGNPFSTSTTHVCSVCSRRRDGEWLRGMVARLDDFYERRWQRLSLADQRLVRDLIAGMSQLAGPAESAPSQGSAKLSSNQGDGDV